MNRNRNLVITLQENGYVHTGEKLGYFRHKNRKKSNFLHHKHIILLLNLQYFFTNSIANCNDFYFSTNLSDLFTISLPIYLHLTHYPCKHKAGERNTTAATTQAKPDSLGEIEDA